MRLFVVGREGQVARSLREAARHFDDVILHCASRAECDLLKPESISAALAAFQPDVVINPAAYTAVDKAESEPGLAFAINGGGARAIAAAAAQSGVPVIHFSTDYVFDGTKPGFYEERDPVNPQSVYGRSKLAGEAAVADANPNHIILRTSWIYAPFGNNFVRSMLRLAAEREQLRVVDDQIGCPTYAPDVAMATIAIAKQINGERWQPRFAGVVHLAGPEALSWCGFARTIMAAAPMGVRTVPVAAIRTQDYPTAAIRPANSRLATARLQALFGVKLPPLRTSLADCFMKLGNN